MQRTPASGMSNPIGVSPAMASTSTVLNYFAAWAGGLPSGLSNPEFTRLRTSWILAASAVDEKLSSMRAELDALHHLSLSRNGNYGDANADVLLAQTR